MVVYLDLWIRRYLPTCQSSLLQQHSDFTSTAYTINATGYRLIQSPQHCLLAGKFSFVAVTTR